MVLRYSGYKPSRSDFKRYNNIRNRREPENPIVCQRIEYYAEARLRWIREKSRGATFTIELHSTPRKFTIDDFLDAIFCGRAPNRINVELEYFALNKKLKNRLYNYSTVFRSSHLLHTLDIIPGNFYPAFFSHIIAELYHYPDYVKTEEATLIVKDICEYLSTNL